MVHGAYAFFNTSCVVPSSEWTLKEPDLNHSCFQSRSCTLIPIASRVGFLPANKQNAVSSWTSCTKSSLNRNHPPVSLLCLVFGSAPFAFYVLSGHEPDLLGFCGWFGFVLVFFVVGLWVFWSFWFRCFLWSGSFPRTPHVNSSR